MGDEEMEPVPDPIAGYAVLVDLPDNAWAAAAEALRWAANRLDAEDQAQGLLAPGGEGFDAFRLRAWAAELEEAERG